MLFTINDLTDSTFSPLYRDGERVNKWYVMYDLDECERCEIECQAPNAVNVELPHTYMHADGTVVVEVGSFIIDIKHRKELPDELGYSEGFGGAVCSHCYQLEEGGV